MSYEVVWLEDIFSDYKIERSILEDIEADLTITPASTVPEVMEAASTAHGAITTSAPVTDEVFRELEALEVVGKCGIGVDTIDVKAAAAHGVTVVNVPDYCIEEVSTHALALLLASLRNLRKYDSGVRNANWDWRVGAPIDRMKGKTLGFAAFGTIPRRLAEKVQGFGLDLIAYDPYISDDIFQGYGVESVEKSQLFSESDMLSVHLPLTNETEDFVDFRALSMLSDDAILVNTSRGGVIDQGSLVTALEEGSLRFAALDVLANEPPTNSDLLDREDVLVSPHTAWYSEESKSTVKGSVAADIANVLTGAPPNNPVSPDEESW